MHPKTQPRDLSRSCSIFQDRSPELAVLARWFGSHVPRGTRWLPGIASLALVACGGGGGGGGGSGIRSSDPQVVITEPGSGSPVSGVTTVSAAAVDADGIAAVQFELDGV